MRSSRPQIDLSSPKAARASLFAEPSMAFLSSLRPSVAPKDCVDVGCGPGVSTRLVRSRFPRASLVLGVDRCKNCIRDAGARVPGATFVVASVDADALPVTNADVIFGRTILSHLAHPMEAVSSWVSRLRRGGVLALEEVEKVTTADPLFSKYLEIVGSRTHGGATLMAAARMSKDSESQTIRFVPNSADVAAVFAFMLRSSRSSGVDGLIDALDAIASGAKEVEPIEWTIRCLLVGAPARR